MTCCGCIPICILKIMPMMGAIITICLGIGSIVVSILVKKIDENFLQCGNWQHYKDIVFISLLVFGICVILIGLMGIYGSIKARLCFLLIFLIFVIIFTLVFAGFLGGYIYGNDYIKNNFGDCQTEDLFQDADQAYVYATNSFCKIVPPYYNETINGTVVQVKGPACPCTITQDQLQNGGWNASTIAILSNSPYSISNFENPLYRVDNCNDSNADPKLTNFSSSVMTLTGMSQEDYNCGVSILSAMETTFDCTGICTPNYVYSFSNVGNGCPQMSCYQKMKTTIDDVFKYGLYIGGIGFAFWFLTAFFLICLMCHPKRHEYIKESIPQGYSENYQKNTTTTGNQLGKVN